MLVFHSGAVDASSVVENNSGTNVDLVAFPVDAVAGVAAIEDNVKIYFNDGNRFEQHAGAGATIATNEVLEKCEVELTVAEGKEFDVVKGLAEIFADVSAKGGFAVFDRFRREADQVCGSDIQHQARLCDGDFRFPDQKSSRRCVPI